MKAAPFTFVCVALASALSLAGCGGLAYTVDRKLLGDLAIEHKLTLFEAENEMFIAEDELEQLSRQAHEARVAIQRAEAGINESESDFERAQAKKDNAAAGLAQSAVAAQGKKIEYLDASLTLLSARLAMQAILVSVADARYELAKAKLVKRNNVRGAAEVMLEDFERQVDQYMEKAHARQADVDAAAKIADAKKNDWRAARQALSKASGGGLGSPWADDSLVWGSF